MKKSIAAIGLCALLFTATTLLAGDDKNAIKPGASIGPVRLKTDITEVEQLLGESPESRILGDGARVWFTKSANGKNEETVVTIRRGPDGHHYFVSEVAVTSPDYRTPAGNSTLSDLAAIWREFPDLAWREAGDSLDGRPMVLFCSRASGVSILVELPAGTPVPDKPAPGIPKGKCACISVQLADDFGTFAQLGIAPKAAD